MKLYCKTKILIKYHNRKIYSNQLTSFHLEIGLMMTLMTVKRLNIPNQFESGSSKIGSLFIVRYCEYKLDIIKTL